MSDTISDRMLAYIKATDHVSFAELGNRFAECRDGDYAVTLRDKNLILWAGMSQEACEAINAMLTAGTIHANPASTLIYLCDGTALRYPVAKRGGPYKKPHWLPVTLRPGPNPKRERAKARKAAAA
jgi:hypothetical protein